MRLRELRSLDHHFRRQIPLEGFILDFVCFGSRLVVEVDGGQHSAGMQFVADRSRDAHLVANGFRVLRFWNSEVDRNLDGVLETIGRALSEGPRLASPTDPPRKGEG
ncbi:MAG TPA: endonuclease domain-containing protein [Xanthobacteraceae bacterium]|nr:endonuclease domain-containing protein [Xanthobacteraceae bacterium]